jgi:hypothetical protein
MRVPDVVGDENNKHTGQMIVSGARDRGTVGLCAVDTAIGQNLGDELYQICELQKRLCDVLTLVQVNGVNDEYLKVIFELLAQSRGLIRQIEVTGASSWSSSTVFPKVEAMRLDCSLL